MAFHDALREIDDHPDDFVILTHVEERELLAIEGLTELTVDDDTATTQARAVLTDRRQMLDRTQAAREAAEAQALVARDRLQGLVEARLRGEPDPGEDDAKRAAVEISLEIDILTTVEAKVGRELKDAEAALAQAVHANKLRVARTEWDRLSAESKATAARFIKSLKEVASWAAKLEEQAQLQTPYAQVLGLGLDWYKARTRLLWPYLRYHLAGLKLPELDHVGGGYLQIVQGKFPEQWPFAQEAPAPEDGDA